MKMKNIAAVAMAGCMAASLAACGGSASSAATDASSAASTEAATSEAAEATGTSANGFTVQLGSNPETLDPALNSAIDGANTIITTVEPIYSRHENIKYLQKVRQSAFGIFFLISITKNNILNIILTMVIISRVK